MEKMTYERPLMHVEMYQTNAYCKMCATVDEDTQLDNVKLGASNRWFTIPSASDMGSLISIDSNQYKQYKDMVFTGEQHAMAGSGGSDQYYWETTSGNTKYYLEYSTGWGDLWKTESGYQDGDKVFVLYKEDGARKPGILGFGGSGSANADRLDAAVDADGWGTWWPGASNDGDNEGGLGSVAYDQSLYDDVLFAVVFGTNEVNSTPWS